MGLAHSRGHKEALMNNNSSFKPKEEDGKQKRNNIKPNVLVFIGFQGPGWVETEGELKILKIAVKCSLISDRDKIKKTVARKDGASSTSIFIKEMVVDVWNSLKKKNQHQKLPGIFSLKSNRAPRDQVVDFASIC